MQPEPFLNHKITRDWRESKSRSPFFRSLLDFSKEELRYDRIDPLGAFSVSFPPCKTASAA
jgi:hypothetical protein